jgi:hypothetical protein
MIIYKLILVVLFIMLSSFFQGQMEKVTFNFYHSMFRKWPLFFNPAVSFFRKYKQVPGKFHFVDKDGVEHVVNQVDKGKERFPLSTSVFVWLTDGWHLFKTVSGFFLAVSLSILVSEILALSMVQGCIAFVLIKVIQGVVFTISFNINKK